jgi:NAD(P)H-nitrite reductase large subunit
MEIHKTYTAVPVPNNGMITPDDLEHIAKVARKHEVPMMKITGAQRISFLGLAPDKLDALKKDLNIPAKPPHARNKTHHVQACPGSVWCKYGSQDSLAMADAIRALTTKKPLPYKVKVGVSGCRMCCCESWVRDVGLIGDKNGWRFIFGGNAAGKPRIGDIVAENLNQDEAVALVEKCLNFYINNAKFKTRSARFMERFGIEELKKSLLE